MFIAILHRLVRISPGICVRYTTRPWKVLVKNGDIQIHDTKEFSQNYTE